MALPKNPKYDLRRTSQRVLEVSFIVALMLVIVAFKFFPHIESESQDIFVPQDLVNVEDIANTKQEQKPPPPPKPPVLIEAAIEDDIVEDLEIEETDLDEAALMDAPPPPIDDSEDEVEEAYIFVPVEEPPAPIGGVAAILKKIEYPEIAKRAGVQGRVYVHAYVDFDGTVTKAELIKGIGAGCDEEALNAVKKTMFSPGKQRGKPVRVRVAVPVIFKLQ